MKRLPALSAVCLVLVFLQIALSGCVPVAAPAQPTSAPLVTAEARATPGTPPETTAPESAGEAGVLRLATTTSTADTGLLDYLLPDFEAANNCTVDVVAVGTGQAIAIGQKGDADVLLVHARSKRTSSWRMGMRRNGTT